MADVDAASIQSAIASRLPQRARWLMPRTESQYETPLDFSFYSEPRNLTAVFAEWGYSDADVTDIEQVSDFIVFGEEDYSEGGGAHPLLVVRQSDGKVFGVDVEAYEPLFLLNSSLQAFIDTFCLLDKYLGHGQPIPADLNSSVRNLDPTVYSESEWLDLVAAASHTPWAEIEARVKQWWGDRLVPVPESALAGGRLSIHTHSFLAKLGVPRDAPLLVTFYTGEELLQPLTVAGETYCVVGDDYGTKIGLRRRGDVWSVDPEGQLPCRFINTSIAHFVLFLGLFEAHEAQFESGNREPRAIAGELRAQFDENDVFALANEENWWSLVLEQAEWS